MNYYFSTILHQNFENAIEKLNEALKKEGFGIISDIDMQLKLKDKLNVDFRKYRILGACNPAFAYEALQKEDKIGTMLPCNIIVQEIGENKIEIAAVDPIASMMAIDNNDLAVIASTVQAKLKRAISELQ